MPRPIAGLAPLALFCLPAFFAGGALAQGYIQHESLFEDERGAFREPDYPQSYPPPYRQTLPATRRETAEEWYYRNYVPPRGAYGPVPPSFAAGVSDEGSPSGDGIFGNEYGANKDSSLY